MVPRNSENGNDLMIFFKNHPDQLDQHLKKLSHGHNFDYTDHQLFSVKKQQNIVIISMEDKNAKF